MPEIERFRVGLIGYGIGKQHALSFRDAPLYYADMLPVEFVSVATTSEASGKRAQAQFGFERRTTDYRAVLGADDINTVIIATPNYLHREMLLAALETDKAIYVDKPLTNDLAQARDVMAVAQERGRDGMVTFQFRFWPAAMLAHDLIQEGALGEIYNFRGVYTRSSYSDLERPLRWKGSKELAGSGVLNDLGSHVFDMLTWLVGEPERVNARLRTYCTRRPATAEGSGFVEIDTDDHFIAQCELPGGGIGTVEAGRMNTGAVNDFQIEVYGSAGSLKFDLMNPNYLTTASALTRSPGGWLKIPAMQYYSTASMPKWDVPIGMQRFYTSCAERFMNKTRMGLDYDPGLEQGLRVQAIMEACLESDETGAWVAVPETE